MNNNRKIETFGLSDEVHAEMKIDIFDGEYLDTEVNIVGSFVVLGSKRNEFCEKLAALINEYRI